MNSKPSKSARKRDAQAIETLARRLLELTDEQLANVPMDAELRAAVVETRNMTARSALRRQRLFLAGQLRRADVSQILQALLDLDHAHLGKQKIFHQAERWRDRMVADRQAVLAEFRAMTGRDNQRLPDLLAELAHNLPEAQERRVAREIFREIHAELTRLLQVDAASI